MAEPSASQEILLEEWKEGRRSVGRFDEYLLTLRRYGFTLATILIGADAYLSMTEGVSPLAKAGAAEKQLRSPQAKTNQELLKFHSEQLATTREILDEYFRQFFQS